MAKSIREIDHALLDEAALVTFLINNEYRNVRMLDSTYWAATSDFMYTAAIVVGLRSSRTGYEDRWCYKDVESARAALASWDGNYSPYIRRRKRPLGYGPGEPSGWHRHPLTGRRVDEFGTMYIAC